MQKAKRLGPDANWDAAKRVFKLFAGIAVEANLRAVLPAGDIRRLPVGVYSIRQMAIEHFRDVATAEAFNVLPENAEVHLAGRPDFVAKDYSRIADLKVSFKPISPPVDKHVKQMRKYQRLARELYRRRLIDRDPRAARRVLVYYVYRNSAKGFEPKFINVAFDPLEPDVREMILRRSAVQLLLAGAKPISAFRQPGYDCRFCPFRNVCPNVDDETIDRRLNGEEQKNLNDFLGDLL